MDTQYTDCKAVKVNSVCLDSKAAKVDSVHLKSKPVKVNNVHLERSGKGACKDTGMRTQQHAQMMSLFNHAQSTVC